jgi:trk system potassium uptake protein TrkA
MNAIIIAIGENFEATVLPAINLIDMNISRVIAPASSETQRRILEKSEFKKSIPLKVKSQPWLLKDLLIPALQCSCVCQMNTKLLKLNALEALQIAHSKTILFASNINSHPLP